MELRSAKHRILAVCDKSGSESPTNVWMSAENLEGASKGLVAHCYSCGRLHRFPHRRLKLSREVA
jgi:hypothetical protein